MAKNTELTESLDRERHRRERLGVPATASGVLYLLGSIILFRALEKLPTVGILQALQPALNGKTAALISPQAAEVKYLSHQAFGLISGTVLQAIAFVFLTLVLVLLLDATQLRSGDRSVNVRRLVWAGGIGTAVIVVVGQIVRAINTHNFAVGHEFTQHAVEQAVTKGASNAIAGYLGLLLPVVLVVGMIFTLLRATRVGLLFRWLRVFGIIAAIILLPIFAQAWELQLIPAAWLVTMGFMFMERLPSGLPPAWSSGEAAPWPTMGRGGAGSDDSTSGGSRGGLPAANGAGDNVRIGDLEDEDGNLIEGQGAGAKKRRRRRGR